MLKECVVACGLIDSGMADRLIQFCRFGILPKIITCSCELVESILLLLLDSMTFSFFLDIFLPCFPLH